MREELENNRQDEQPGIPSPTTDYRPSNKELLRENEVKIRFLSRGCIIRVGCQEIAFESVETAMQELNEYVKNPYETQKKWRKILG
jgi:hypothetical protein